MSEPIHTDNGAPELRREVIVPGSRELSPAALVIYMSIAYMILYVASAVVAFLPFGLLHLVLPLEAVP